MHPHKCWTATESYRLRGLGIRLRYVTPNVLMQFGTHVAQICCSLSWDPCISELKEQTLMLLCPQRVQSSGSLQTHNELSLRPNSDVTLHHQVQYMYTAKCSITAALQCTHHGSPSEVHGGLSRTRWVVIYMNEPVRWDSTQWSIC